MQNREVRFSDCLLMLSSDRLPLLFQGSLPVTWDACQTRKTMRALDCDRFGRDGVTNYRITG